MNKQLKMRKVRMRDFLLESAIVEPERRRMSLLNGARSGRVGMAGPGRGEWRGS